MIFIGLDDTDNLESRGTGNLARQIASKLVADYPVLGVTRHQLFKDPRVPCTKNNSSAAITLDLDETDLSSLFDRVRSLMLADFQPGSDPGLCVASSVPPAVIGFGFRVQSQLVDQREARDLANEYGLYLQGLGGTQDGVIGALAAVGLAACGEDGRYVQVGQIRDLAGLQTVANILDAGVAFVQNAEGQPVQEGMVLTDKLRPARRGGRPVAVVDWSEDHWLPLKLD